ncbi:protein kinase domain-containing protein, partial [Enterococcus faecium]
RVGKNRSISETIANQITEDLDSAYRAPELVISEQKSEPKEASIASDLFSAGLVFYELLTGELPYENIDQMIEADGKFPIKPSEHKPDF